MRKKLGVIIHRPGQDQKFYTLSQELNKLVEDDSNLDVIVFYMEYGMIPFKIKFSMMQLSQIYDYDGVLISTDILTTKILDKTLCAKKRFFYIWDLEWIYSQNKFSELNNVYNNDNIELIVRSNTHYDLVNRIWKEPYTLMEDFNYAELRKIQ